MPAARQEAGWSGHSPPAAEATARRFSTGECSESNRIQSNPDFAQNLGDDGAAKCAPDSQLAAAPSFSELLNELCGLGGHGVRRTCTANAAERPKNRHAMYRLFAPTMAG